MTQFGVFFVDSSCLEIRDKQKEISCGQWIQLCDLRNVTGGRCDFYLKTERCLKQHNLEYFFCQVYLFGDYG